jgi:hypothetical protein
VRETVLDSDDVRDSEGERLEERERESDADADGDCVGDFDGQPVPPHEGERLIVIDVSEERDAPMVLINPELVWTSQGRHMNEEGCLSVPGIYDGVKRSTSVTVQALDLDGKLQTHQAEGMLAVCIQHEMDHLMGKVFVEYLSPLKRNRIKTKLVKQQRDDERYADQPTVR